MIVLDTHAWIWWVTDPTRLGTKASAAIIAAELDQAIVVSSISVWEIAVKVSLGKLTLDRDIRVWIAAASMYPGLTVHPVDPSDALESTLLPGTFHKDPADRMLIALARRLDAPLVTNDAAIRRYRHVKTLW